ncbi:MAG: DUF2344 domain-containing protein [Lachnospiraceae bacterium]|nr:DUF2344 domain-containing protein [Lachnospiraceae bacterium]
MKIRIKFERNGVMKFVGHLDIMRYFQKAIRRADFDIAYSEGYSPHQIMSFAAPLGVGITSSGEYLDIQVHSTRSSLESVERLNQVSVDGILVKSYRKLEDSAPNAMSIVAAADYEVRFRIPPSFADWQEKLLAFYRQPSILITKKTKKSEREIDLKPLILALDLKDSQVNMRLSTGSVDNIKPELVMEAFYHSLGLTLPEFCLLIHRQELYARTDDSSSCDGSNAEKTVFTALEDLGEEIE